MKASAERAFSLTIDGIATAAPRTFAVVNPATGAPFAEAPDCSEDQLDAAMAAAGAAFVPWSRDDEARRATLRAIADVVEGAIDELAPLLTAEMGRPLAGAEEELSMAVHWARYFAEIEAPAPEMIQDDPRGHAVVVHRPVGPVAAITPWNYPVLLAFYKLAPALRAGNTLVLKPSPYTPLTTLRIGELLAPVLPPGVLNVVSGVDPLGALMTSHPVPRKVAFTGSVATGRRVAIAAAEDFKRVTLELGGNDAAIVLDDLDLPSALPTLFWSAFVNSGQLCCATKRVYVPRSRHDEIVEALADFAGRVVVDDGMAPAAELGPLNNGPQRDRVADLVADAIGRGARVATGGKAPDRPGFFFEPTILSGVGDGVAVVDEEQFGPVLPIVPYRDEEEAIAKANASHYGLNGSVWTADLDHGQAVAERLEVGTAAVNVGSIPEPHMPFGGVGRSGIGRENGRWGLLSFTEIQTIFRSRDGGG